MCFSKSFHLLLVLFTLNSLTELHLNKLYTNIKLNFQFYSNTHSFALSWSKLSVEVSFYDELTFINKIFIELLLVGREIIFNKSSVSSIISLL